jgi:hypothetical protein
MGHVHGCEDVVNAQLDDRVLARHTLLGNLRLADRVLISVVVVSISMWE